MLRVAGQNVPFGGGGYFRLLPASWLVRAYHAASDGRPWGNMFYLHPWEIDPDQPRVPGSGFLANLRHRLGLRSAAAKLEDLGLAAGRAYAVAGGEADAEAVLAAASEGGRRLPYAIALDGAGGICARHLGLLGTERARDWMRRCST